MSITCNAENAQKKAIRALGLQASTIADFRRRTTVDNGIPVAEFDYDPPTRGYKPRGTAGIVAATPTAYNGVVTIPLSCSAAQKPRLLVATIYYGGVPIQVAVYDAKNASEGSFTGSYLSSSYAVSAFISQVNHGGFPMATTSDASSTNAYFSILCNNAMMFEEFGRVGIVGGPNTLVSVANVRFTNAFWTGFCMVFGNGGDSGGRVLPLTAMDVCGHELTHGLQTFSTEFDYEKESGALNESTADVFGIFQEFRVNSAVDVPDWTLGEQFKFIIRNLADPKACRQPTLYGGEFWVDPNSEEDNGGVHTNSGVTNYLCYLSSVGSSGAEYIDERGVNHGVLTPPEGFGLREYTKILFQILVSRVLPSNATLANFARALVTHAKVFGGDAVAHHVSKCAVAVGLMDAPTPPPPPPPPTFPDPTSPAPPLPPPSDEPEGSGRLDFFRTAVGGSYCAASVFPAANQSLVLQFFDHQLTQALASSPCVIQVWDCASDPLASGTPVIPGRAADDTRLLTFGDAPPAPSARLDGKTSFRVSLQSAPVTGTVARLVRVSCDGAPWLHVSGTSAAAAAWQKTSRNPTPWRRVTRPSLDC